MGVIRPGRCGTNHATVHPHVRGVYSRFSGVSSMSTGTSPRAWGLYLAPSISVAYQRFIPTCVGFMSGTVAMCSMDLGTSPRAWGLCRGADKPFGCGRFIPTCVGFMARKIGGYLKQAVHPHVRGVYRGLAGFPREKVGSSPRAWGLCFLPVQ